MKLPFQKGTALGIMLFIRTWFSPTDETNIGPPNQLFGTR